MALRENWAEFRVSVIFVSNYKNSGGEKNSVIIEACYSLPCLAMSWGSCNHITIKTAKDEALGCNHPFIWRISWKRNDVGVQMLNTFLISGVRDFAIGLPYPQSSTAPGEGGRGVLSVLQILTLNLYQTYHFSHLYWVRHYRKGAGRETVSNLPVLS